MTLGTDTPDLGRRARRTKRVRAELVDAAVRLYLAVGYERATVEMIAAAADVSPRTLSRYFASKDEMFLAVLDPVTDRLIAAVSEQPDDLGPLEALRAAYVAVLTGIADRPLGQPSADDVVVMLRVVNSSNALSNKATRHRNQRMKRILTARTGAPLDDRTAELVTTVFDATMAHAFAHLVADTDASLLCPRMMVERLDEAFDHFAEFADGLTGGGSASDQGDPPPRGLHGHHGDSRPDGSST